MGKVYKYILYSRHEKPGGNIYSVLTNAACRFFLQNFYGFIIYVLYSVKIHRDSFWVERARKAGRRDSRSS